MHNIKSLIICIAVVLTTYGTTYAQTTFDVPENVVLKTPSDFSRYEQDVVKAAKWLEQTDINKETAKRKDVFTFVLEWISGSPDLTVEIKPALSKIYGDNADLLGIYLANYAASYIENKNKATTFSETKAGIISMMNVYKKGIRIKKSSEMEKLIKLNDKELDEYINAKLM
jgi:hypothetical protein